MSKTKYGSRFTSALERKGWSVEIYGPVWEKCATPQALREEEYNHAMHLAEIGLMTITRTPIWIGGSFAGVKVEFLKYVPL